MSLIRPHLKAIFKVGPDAAMEQNPEVTYINFLVHPSYKTQDGHCFFGCLSTLHTRFQVISYQNSQAFLFCNLSKWMRDLIIFIKYFVGWQCPMCITLHFSTLTWTTESRTIWLLCPDLFGMPSYPQFCRPWSIFLYHQQTSLSNLAVRWRRLRLKNNSGPKTDRCGTCLRPLSI